jgi:hypothetical protein
MKIIIKYQNKKFNIITKNYQSINSIINQYLNENNIEDEISNYFIEYNGKYLNKDYSLEKYNISDQTILTLNKKNKGGNSFFSFIGEHPIMVCICLLISLAPLIILPMGFVPSTASMIKLIIDKGFESIGRYLVCTLGKITIFKRLKFFITIIKYVIFILMIFVIITFPLLLLCITLKGHSVLDNPSNMCGAIGAGNMAGLIVTSIYVMIYVSMRCGDIILRPIIDFFKKIYVLNTTINPILQSILNAYDKLKYIPVTIIPFLGQGIAGYFTALTILMEALKIILGSIVETGCKMTFDKGGLMKSITTKFNSMLPDCCTKKEDKPEEPKVNKIKLPENPEDICIADTSSECCKPSNYVNIADVLMEFIKNSLSSKLLKEKKVFPSFVLVIQAFYESALLRISGNENYLSGSDESKKFYLRKLLQNKINVLDIDVKNLIKEYLETSNNKLIQEIQNKLNTSSPSDKETKRELREKLTELDQIMINFARNDGSTYIPGNSLFKTIMKIVLTDIFCNVFSTAKGAQDIISKMGEMDEVVDMLKAGSTAGIFTAIIYFITVIVLIICGIFNVF